MSLSIDTHLLFKIGTIPTQAGKVKQRICFKKAAVKQKVANCGVHELGLISWM